MHDASGMLAVVQEIRSPTVLHRDPGELLQDPNRFQGRLTSALINVLVGEGGRASHVHPVPFSCYIQSCFILMDHFALDQGLFDLLLHRGQPQCAALDQVTDGPFTHLDSQRVPHHLTGVGQGQQLLFNQIHRRRSHVGSILDGACTPAGNAAMVIYWQWGHCFCSARYSRTHRRGDGRSTTCRRSVPHVATACRSCWQASQRSTCC